MKYFPLLSLILLLIFASCQKDEEGPNQDPNPNPSPSPNPNPPANNAVDVYLLGKDGSEPGGPAFWKNMVKTNIQTTWGGEGNSIQVSGGTVYIGGRIWLNGGLTRCSPCYWRNGNKTDLPFLDPRGDGFIKSIYITDKVYAAGTCTDSLEFFANSGWRYLPCFWDGSEIKMLDRLNNFGGGFANAVTVLKNANFTVPYVAGESMGKSGYNEPCYWRMALHTSEAENLKPYPLSTKGFGGSATAIATFLDAKFQGNAFNTDVIIAGFIDDENGSNTPCFWRNGDREDLSEISKAGNGIATAITLAGSSNIALDIYTAGFTYNAQSLSIPCVWKNQIRTDLPLPNNSTHGRATACRINNGDVYVGGTVVVSGVEKPCYWKNSQIVLYNTSGSVNAMDLVSN